MKEGQILLGILTAILGGVGTITGVSSWNTNQIDQRKSADYRLCLQAQAAIVAATDKSTHFYSIPSCSR